LCGEEFSTGMTWGSDILIELFLNTRIYCTKEAFETEKGHEEEEEEEEEVARKKKKKRRKKEEKKKKK